MALDSYVKSDVEGTITFVDGTGSPVSHALVFDRGDINIQNLKKILNETEKYEARGRLKSVGPGSRIYPTVAFSAFFHQATDATGSTIPDFLLKANKYSANVSTLGANHPIQTVNIQYDIEGTDFGGSDTTFTLNDVDCTINFTEGRPSSLSISGEVLGAVTGDIAVAEIA